MRERGAVEHQKYVFSIPVSDLELLFLCIPRCAARVRSKVRWFCSVLELMNVLILSDKDKWIMKERVRWAKLFNVPMLEESPEASHRIQLP